MANNDARRKRLESFLRREIASCLTTQVHDALAHRVAITRVAVTGDLHQVVAYYSVIGRESDRPAVANLLNRVRGFVQSSYASSVRMRTLPRLEFRFDEQEERRQLMDDLISRARSTDPDHQVQPPADASGSPA